MHVLICRIDTHGTVGWQAHASKQPESEDEAFRLEFSLAGRWTRQDAIRRIAEALARKGIKWLRRNGARWALNAGGLLNDWPQLAKELTWFRAEFVVEPDVTDPQPLVFFDADRTGYETTVRFSLYRDEALLQRQQHIFLSHKGANKPMARRFSMALESLGFSPWLDEEAMPAGTELNRGILKGFHDSCAAVFLITPEFKDEKYLRNEINYAVDEKLNKGDRFAIITLLFADENDKRGVVPDLLRPYVWKEPDSELEALRELIRALPIEVGPLCWRDGQ